MFAVNPEFDYKVFMQDQPKPVIEPVASSKIILAP
jgi:hypothetical protein